ncbi:hypothetical protein C8R48DRAFT_678037 [Suillus tomentosus]|nr:hypothetical protein C8R48DRAFT_678037 [Suillus tomentosus]
MSIGSESVKDILSQVSMITNKIGSIQSEKLDKVSCKKLKNDCYIAKHNLTRQENKHQFLQAEYQDECMNAATIHQCLQEAKDTEIYLHEVEAKVHKLLAQAHAEKAALLYLKIQYCQLTALLFDIPIATVLPIIMVLLILCAV